MSLEISGNYNNVYMENMQYRQQESEEKAGEKTSEEPVVQSTGNGKKKGDASEKCIADTDRVDREIEKLKEEKKQLVQQIKAATGDKEKVRQLQQKLAYIEAELGRKDNDLYRRRNTDFIV